jgi:hypothetical protein
MSDTNAGVRHERSDINARVLLNVALGFIVFAIITHVALGGLFKLYREEAGHNDSPPSPLSSSALAQPPLPRLQVSPPLELNELREAERKLLSSYGWVDRKTQVVRVPIERAMDIIVERGLPDWQDKAQTPAAEQKP